MTPRLLLARLQRPSLRIAGGVFIASAAATWAIDSYATDLGAPHTSLWRVAHGARRTARAFVAGAGCVLDYRMLAWQYPSHYAGEDGPSGPPHVSSPSSLQIDAAYEDALRATHERCAARLAAVFKTNGGVYAKLGQHVAALSHLVPAQYVDAMRELHDNCPASEFDDIEAMFLAETGNPLDESFAYFDRRPVGVASLAQVHYAVTNEGGRRVAVKLQHPTIREFSALDIWVTARMARLVKALLPDFKLDWLAREMEANLPLELDFRNEARNARRLQSNFAKGPRRRIHVPRVEWATERVLCMEYVDGFRVDDVDAVRRSRVSAQHVNLELTRIFNDMVFRHGFVHADPHPGNILIVPRPRSFWLPLRADFSVCVLDHGLYRELDAGFRRDYAEFWAALFANNESRVRHAAGAFVPADRVDALYGLLACMVSGRSWESLSGGAGVVSRISDDEAAVIRRGAAVYARQVAAVLAGVPSPLLLVLKTNDLLRDLQRRLRADERVAALAGYTGVLRCLGTHGALATAIEWALCVISGLFRVI